MTGPWTPTVPSDEVVGPTWPTHDVAGTAIRLVRDDDGTIRAVGAACPHLGSPLTRAEVADGRLACPVHFYEFALDDGRCLHPGYADVNLRVYPTRVIDGVVEVQVPAGPP